VVKAPEDKEFLSIRAPNRPKEAPVKDRGLVASRRTPV